MKKVYILPSFERSVKKLTPQQKLLLAKGLESFNHYLETGQSSPGFGLKKISQNNYEFRLDIRLRLILKTDKEAFYLILVGDHNDVRRYLREYK
jgi:mRNA-degrading endonuclease RelE of RelBE toxin-antitoxin system